MALPPWAQSPMYKVTDTLYSQYKKANPPRPGDPPPMMGNVEVIASQDAGYQQWLSQNPMANAQAMAAQGVTVPTEIQKAVFQEASAKNMTAQDLESFFGMPAGTASQTAAALGIADSISPSLGGRGMRPEPQMDPGPPRLRPPEPMDPSVPGPPPPPPPPPPIPPERPMADPGFPDPPPSKVIPDLPTGIQGDYGQGTTPLERAQYEFAATGQVSPELQIAAFEQASQQGMIGSELEQMFNMPAGTAAEFALQNQLDPLADARGTPPPREPEQSDPIGGIGSIAELGNTAISTTYVDPATGLPTSTPPPQYSQEEIMGVVDSINSGQRTVEEVAAQYGVSPEYVQNNLNQINQQTPPPMTDPGFPNPPPTPVVDYGRPAFRPDGNYTPAEVAAVTKMLQDGTMTFEQASQFYKVPVEQIQQNFAELSQQPPPPQTPGYATLPVEPPIPTPVTTTPPTPQIPQTPVNTPTIPNQGGLTPGADVILGGGEGDVEFPPGSRTLPPNLPITPPVVTPPVVTPPVVTPPAGTFDTTTIEGLINKYKTAPDQVTEADTRSLIDMAKQQNLDTFTLANMAGVSQDFITKNLTDLGYNADYLRSSPTTDLKTQDPVVTTPTGAQTTITREAPEIEARKLGLIDLAKTLAEKEPAGGLPAQQVAGLSPLEQEAYRMAQAYRGVALEAPKAGYETLGEVKRGLQDAYHQRIPISDYGTEKYLREYDPFVTHGIGTMLGAEGQAAQAGRLGRNAAMAGIGSLGESRARTRGAGDIGYATTARGIRELAGTTGQFDPATGTSAYMNPYETAVIDAAMGDLTRAGEQQKQALRARAVQAGAFGGNRAALAESELDRNLLEQQAKTAAGLRAQGYGQAQQNAMTAFEAAQQRGQRAGQLIGGMGAQAAQVGLQTGQGIGDFARSISALGQQGAGTQLQAANTMGNLAGLSGRLGEARSKLGLQGVDQYGRTTQDIIKMGDLGRQIGINQGEMGRLGQDILIRDIASLEAAGQAERGQQQRILDAQRANRMQDIQEPYQRASWMSDIMRGAPSSQMQMVKKYEQQPSAAAQAIGGIGSLASTAAGAKKAGII